MRVINGAEVSAAINQEITSMLAGMRVEERLGRRPCLAIVRVGEQGDEMAYERGAMKRMQKVGLDCKSFTFPENVNPDWFTNSFDAINSDDSVDGILLLRPLPKQLDEADICSRIAPEKDVDGISPINAARIYSEGEGEFMPCTAAAVVAMLDYAGIDLTGKRAVVVGRSMVIGKPLSMLLLARNATVTICHSKTVDLAGVCREADVLVAAAGCSRLITAEHVRSGAVVIDVGINTDECGNLCGDVDFDSASENASIITPVPGGVGAVTTSVLAKHVLLSAIKKL